MNDPRTALDRGYLFPWGVGEVRASLALCPPGAFHVRGLRLERVSDGWWGDLTVYREDQGAVFVWPGFRIRRGRGFEVAPPPYLADLDGSWRAVVLASMQRLVAAGVEAPAGDCLFVAVEQPDGVPAPGHLGGERVTPAAPAVLRWVARAKRYRLAAGLSREASVVDLGCGLGEGSRLLARLARRVTGVESARETATYAARAYRSPRLAFVAGDTPSAYDGPVDIVTALADEPWMSAERLVAHAADVLGTDGRLVVAAAPGEAAETLRAALAARFADVALWWQRPAAGLGDVLDEHELVAAPTPGAALVAVAARPQPARCTAAPRRSARTDVDAALARGAAHLAADEIREACVLFAAVVDAEPTSVPALVGLAHCALSVDNVPVARTVLSRILSLDPAHGGARAAVAALDDGPREAVTA